MPKPRVQEKSKDFFGSMKRLLKNLRPWRYFMGFALILAMISAILSLIAPNKLSNLTDEISSGLVPRTYNLKIIAENMQNNLNEEKINIIRISIPKLINIENKIQKYLNNQKPKELPVRKLSIFK